METSEEKIKVIKKKTNQKRLGMGLSALLGGIEDVDIFSANDGLFSSNEIMGMGLKGFSTISIDRIIPNKTQPRKVFLEDELLKLSDSIAQNGILQPILVRKTEDNLFEIVAGERRYRASKLAGLKEIPCTVKELSDSQVFILAIIENVQREDLNPLEEAQSYAKLIHEFSYKQEQVAELVGKSRSHISNLLRLLKLPEEVKKHLEEGKLTSGHVRPLLALKTEEQIINVADVILENSYSVRKVEELVSLILSDEEKLENLETNLEKIGKKIEEKLELSKFAKEVIKVFEAKFISKIKIKTSKNGGVISIKYKTEEELSSIMQNFVEIPKKQTKSAEVITLPNKADFLSVNL
jgi:ParB family chromosome partitioning protein